VAPAQNGPRPPTAPDAPATGGGDGEDFEELAAAPVDGAERRRRARRAFLKLAVLVVIVGVGFYAARYTPLARYLTKEGLQQSVQATETAATIARLREAWWTPLALLALYLVLGPAGVPITVAVIAGAVVFGPLLGAVYNVVGAVASAVLSFLVARALGRDFIVHLAGERLQRVERFLAHRGFWPLVRSRFLPFPFVIVNYGAAMAGVPLSLFAAASAAGLAPSVAVYSYFWSTSWSAFVAGAQGEDWKRAVANLFIAISLLMMLSLVPNVVRWARRSRRSAGQRGA
jgi:uncharacterized membrane protein YdjX (TVP38/TMEM64 family)